MLANLSQRLWCRRERRRKGRQRELKNQTQKKQFWAFRRWKLIVSCICLPIHGSNHFFFLTLNHCIQSVRKESDWCKFELSIYCLARLTLLVVLSIQSFFNKMTRKKINKGINVIILFSSLFLLYFQVLYIEYYFVFRKVILIYFKRMVHATGQGRLR